MGPQEQIMQTNLLGRGVTFPSIDCCSPKTQMGLHHYGMWGEIVGVKDSPVREIKYLGRTQLIPFSTTLLVMLGTFDKGSVYEVLLEHCKIWRNVQEAEEYCRVE